MTSSGSGGSGRGAVGDVRKSPSRGGKRASKRAKDALAGDPGSARDRPLRIALVATEVAPFAKVGGLADVTAALPRALKAIGHDVRVVMPCYPLVEQNQRFSLHREATGIPVRVSPTGAADEFSVFSTEGSGAVPVYMVRHRAYFQNAVSPSALYPQPVDAYLLFSQAVLALLNQWDAEGWSADILQANDWHTGLIPTLLRFQEQRAGRLAQTASVFTLHNLVFQGLTEAAALDRVGLPRTLFTPEGLEFYGRVSFLKAGLIYSAMVNTVSPTYAREIQTPEYGAGLDGVLRGLADVGRLRGILNGIDTEVYDPRTDPLIVAPFSADDPSRKGQNRLALQESLGLTPQNDQPLVGIVSRLFAQKGLDILAQALEAILARGFQFAVIGQGELEFESVFIQAQIRHPAQVAARIGYDEALGQQVYAGSDLFLMPSRFEPCGLGQLIAQRYGSLPVVRRTGGLGDTVVDEGTAGATGFLFGGVAPETLLECLKRAQSVYRDRATWKTLVQNAMRADFSWARSAREYERFYLDAIEARRTP